MMIFGTVIFGSILIISQILGEELVLNEDVSAIKRGPMGFQGMRGKKDSPDSLTLESDDYSKRAPMGFQGMRGKKDPTGPDLDENIIELDNIDKQMPMDYYEGLGSRRDLLSNLDEAFYHEEYDKRAPMGFQGMRGKKTSLTDEYLKRAAMGFQGMRGKKNIENILDELEKRWNIPTDQRSSLMYNDYLNDYDKRAMAMGFQGMRGKKATYLNQIEDLEKRGMISFQGVRGKKGEQMFDNYYEYSDPMDYDKRASMGFQGMRGKKEGIKRMGFVGMRGKRNVLSIYNDKSAPLTYLASPDLQDSRLIDNSIPFDKRASFGFLGMRGKKIPRWEIRGKFIGVRGKKGQNNQLTNDLKTTSADKFNDH